MLKRFIDIVFAAVMLAIMLAPMLVIAVLVLIDLGWPVIFAQQRPGLRGRPFLLFKFRTMTDARDKRGELLADELRLTRFGRFLRRTSLDELPELANVLIGDMSLVGPRPLLMEYLPLYTLRQARRHELRPGLTGWAQINGRNALGWEEKLELDAWYVEHRSLPLDLRILAVTLVRVVTGEGVSAPNQATMSRFTGRSGASR